MPRRARLDLPGLLQHVIARGIEGRDIFADPKDRESFVHRLSRLLASTHTQCFAWSLLSNHFHLLLRPTEGRLAGFMRRLQTGHAVVFNRRHQRSGHLFQNRYKSIVCEEEEYLLTLVRYIHLNPLRAGLVSSMEELDRYPWCGQAVLMGHLDLDGQCVDEVLARFGSTVTAARHTYRSFVEAGIPLGRDDRLVGGGLRRSRAGRPADTAGPAQAFDERILGSGSFVEALWQEEALRDRLPVRLGLEELLRRVARAYGVAPEELRRRRRLPHLRQARAAICYLAVRELGYRGTEAGRVLGMGRAAMSAAVQRGARVVEERPDLLSLVRAPCRAQPQESLKGTETPPGMPS